MKSTNSSNNRYLYLFIIRGKYLNTDLITIANHAVFFYLFTFKLPMIVQIKN